ncbi:MAG: Omp28-related outer membrane protein [Bacteroidota bacterium]
MKSVYVLLTAFLFVANSLTAQRIPPNKLVILKATSTECNVCGLRAWDEFKDVVEKYERDHVVMAVHPFDISKLYSRTAEELVNNMPTFFGTPSLYTNEETHFNFWFDGIRDAIDPWQARRVTAHPEIDFQINGNELTAEVNTQFLFSTNRPHYVAVYLVEDKIKEFQDNRGPEDLHSKILRTHLGESTFGTLLSESNIEANQQFTNTFSMELDPEWKPENLEVATIIWERRGETYHIVNANKAATASFSTSINILEKAKVQLAVQPTMISDIATIQLDLPTAQADLNIRIVNTLGQTIQTIFTGNLPQGTTTFDLNRNAIKEAGLYFLVAEKEGSRLTEKIIVR